MPRIRYTRTELSWALYDWASSAFTLMLATVIPIYLKNIGEGAGFSPATTTSHWAITQSLSTLLVALASPFLGALADRNGRKKPMFFAFLVLSLSMGAAMTFLNSYALLLAACTAACVGYAATNVFYDSFLVDVTENDRMDALSSFGYAIGYIGSCIPFVAGILLIAFAAPLGLDSTAAVQLSMLINIAWWLVFSLPLLKNVRQTYSTQKTSSPGSPSVFARLRVTLREICQNKPVGMFLLAYFFYIDGVDTIIKMSTSFGKDVGIGDSTLLLALLMTQLVAFPAVLIFSKLVKRFSAKKIISFSILVYIGICVFGFFLRHAWQFWLLAFSVALVQGTIQALSRAYFGRLVPKDRSNEYFGFYNIFGKYASILGTALMALLTAITGSSRYGVLSVALLFITGYVLLRRTPDPKN